MSCHLLFLDFETYYDSEYSLRKMTPAEYILDPRYETIMVAVKLNDGRHQIVDGPDFPRWLQRFNPKDVVTVTFNSLFDNAVLAWKYGFLPGQMIDAMGMARSLDGHRFKRFSLASIAEQLGFPPKGNTVQKVTGMRRADFSPELFREYGAYSVRDNELCEKIFLHYYRQMPKSELALMDMVLRCCVDPRFQLNTTLLDNHIGDIVAHKEQLILNAGNVPRIDIMSNLKFKAALERLGVDLSDEYGEGYKHSPTAKHPDGTPKRTLAFAKTDEFMETLVNHADPQIAALAAARVGFKSTIEETRSRTLMRIGQLRWQYTTGNCPIPLRYGGAHTHRLSGDWKMNMQNMPRVRGSKGKSKLRLSLCAPPDHTVVTCDLGQIEARLSAWICGADSLIEQFAKYDAGDKSFDPYNCLASEIFRRPVDRKLSGPDEIMGFIGKTGILGLGYGCGKDNFHAMVTRNARAQCMDISQVYSRDIGDKAVDLYRGRFHQLPAGWRTLNHYIANYWLPSGGNNTVQFGPVTIGHGYVLLPSGMKLKYAEPKRVWKADDQGVGGRWEYSYRYGKCWHRLYGAKLLENITQALARIVVMDAALRIRAAGRYRPCPWAYRFVLQAHDELVFIVPDEELNEAKRIIHQEMVRRPSWGPDIPLVAEIGAGNSYGAAK